MLLIYDTMYCLHFISEENLNVDISVCVCVCAYRMATEDFYLLKLDKWAVVWTQTVRKALIRSRGLRSPLKFSYCLSDCLSLLRNEGRAPGRPSHNETSGAQAVLRQKTKAAARRG